MTINFATFRNTMINKYGADWATSLTPAEYETGYNLLTDINNFEA